MIMGDNNRERKKESKNRAVKTGNYWFQPCKRQRFDDALQLSFSL
jgi:hypothetical protein